jgi:ABC-type multidrug transport system ATPase subunit
MICFHAVAFSYRRGEPVLSGVNLALPAGLTLVVGPNGCGKSTLLKLAAGIEPPDAGCIEIDGCDLWTEEVAARADLAFVPEQPDLTPYATVAEILALVSALRRAAEQCHGCARLRWPRRSHAALGSRAVDGPAAQGGAGRGADRQPASPAA